MQPRRPLALVASASGSQRVQAGARVWVRARARAPQLQLLLVMHGALPLIPDLGDPRPAEGCPDDLEGATRRSGRYLAGGVPGHALARVARTPRSGVLT